MKDVLGIMKVFSINILSTESKTDVEFSMNSRNLNISQSSKKVLRNPKRIEYISALLQDA